jgi:hypothetical protein
MTVITWPACWPQSCKGLPGHGRLFDHTGCQAAASAVAATVDGTEPVECFYRRSY